MTLEELTSKIDKKEQQILKLTAKLNKLLSKDNLESCLSKYDVSSIDELVIKFNIPKERFDNVIYPEYRKWLSYDIRRAQSDLADANATLAKYKKKLDELSTKSSSTKIKIIEEFLLNWKRDVTNIIIDNIDVVDNYFALIHKRNSQFTNMSRSEKESIQSEIENLKSEIYPLTFLVYNEKLDRHIDLAKLSNELDKEVESKYSNMIRSVEKYAGEIVDASNLSIGLDGNINGIIIGTSGTVKISTVLAGGYNQNVIVNVKHGQILHHRLLIKKIS